MSNQFSIRLKSVLQSKDIKQSELSRMTSLGKMKISRTLNGSRYPSKKELVEIAEALELSVDRLTGSDIASTTKHIEYKLEEKKDLNDVIRTTNGLLKISICNSETVDLLNYQARAYYLLDKYDHAQLLWEQVLELLDTDIDLQRQARAYHNLVLAYKAQKLTMLVIDTYNKAEKVFDGSPDLLARFAHLKAGVLGHNPAEAKENYLKAIKLYEVIGDSINRGRAYVGLANVCFKEEDYKSAMKYLELSLIYIIDDLQKTNYWQAKRDLAKVLIFLKKKGKALEIVEESLNNEKEMNKDLYATFLLLKSIILKKAEILKPIIEDSSGLCEDIVLCSHILVNIFNINNIQNTSCSNDRPEIKMLLNSFGEFREIYTDEYILRRDCFS